jgi:hypothetical protein
MTLFSIYSSSSGSLTLVAVPPERGDRLRVVMVGSTGNQMFPIYHWHVSCPSLTTTAAAAAAVQCMTQKVTNTDSVGSEKQAISRIH